MTGRKDFIELEKFLEKWEGRREHVDGWMEGMKGTAHIRADKSGESSCFLV